jgi:hypothetical protein
MIARSPGTSRGNTTFRSGARRRDLLLSQRSKLASRAFRKSELGALNAKGWWVS